MIHHVSIPARNPKHVAAVLAELMGGTIHPFAGPLPDAFAVLTSDPHGSGIEIYPDGTALKPGEGDNMLSMPVEAPVAFHPVHVLMSVKADRATIERVGEREGWRTRHFWRGPRNGPKVFELYEFWVENRILLELATEDMMANYTKTWQVDAMTTLMGRVAV